MTEDLVYLPVRHPVTVSAMREKRVEQWARGYSDYVDRNGRAPGLFRDAA